MWNLQEFIFNYKNWNRNFQKTTPSDRYFFPNLEVKLFLYFVFTVGRFSSKTSDFYHSSFFEKILFYYRRKKRTIWYLEKSTFSPILNSKSFKYKGNHGNNRVWYIFDIYITFHFSSKNMCTLEIFYVFFFSLWQPKSENITIKTMLTNQV